jgi:uncharacterized protein
MVGIGNLFPFEATRSFRETAGPAASRQDFLGNPVDALALDPARKERCAAISAEKPSIIFARPHPDKRPALIPTEPPAAVIDTNVLLDWLVFRDLRVAPLSRAVEARALRWLASSRMRDELAHMLAHGSLVRWQPDSERTLSVFDSLAVECPSPAPSRLHCTDADDQCFIDLALAQRARWLITHDRALLRLARRARPLGVEILTPALWCAGHGVGIG